MSLLLLLPGEPGVIPPIAPVVSPIEVAVMLGGPGPTATWTVLTDVLAAGGLTIKHGIDGSSPLDRVAGTPTCSFALRNDAGNSAGLLGYYSLHHNNTRTGWRLNIPCRVRIQDPSTLVWYWRFVGRIDSIEVQPGRYLSRRVLVTAVGWMDEAARWKLTPEIGEQINKRWDEIILAIIAKMPVSPGSIVIDEGREAYPFALDQSGNAEVSALTEFQKLAASEFGYIFERADGALRLEGRHHRLTTV
jgi:hypothetical protein